MLVFLSTPGQFILGDVPPARQVLAPTLVTDTETVFAPALSMQIVPSVMADTETVPAPTFVSTTLMTRRRVH